MKSLVQPITYWLAGRTWVLKTWWRKILGSAKTGPLEKFAALTELAALSPVLQLSAAILVALLAFLLSGRSRFWIAGLSLTSIASLVVATSIVLVRHPHPRDTLLAFLRLPMYAIWRASVAAATLFLPSSGEWLKTERHSV